MAQFVMFEHRTLDWANALSLAGRFSLTAWRFGHSGEATHQPQRHWEYGASQIGRLPIRLHLGELRRCRSGLRLMVQNLHAF